MRQLPTLLAIMALSSSAALAQIGFSTQTYTAGQDAARPNQLQSAAFVPGGKPDLLLYGSGYLGAKVIYNDGNGGLNEGGKGLNGSKGDLGPAQTGDMNGDGAPDVVACAAGSSPSSSNLEIYLNDGTGKLNLAQTVALPGGCASVNFGDVNKDGELDVVVTSVSGTNPVNNTVQVFPGNGTGQVGSPLTQQNVNFDSTKSNSPFTNCSIIDANGGDFYGDGTYSLMVNTSCRPASNPRGYEGTTFLGRSNGVDGYTFTELREDYKAFKGGKTFYVNKDGKPDAIFISQGTADFDNVDLTYAENTGGGNFTFHSLLSTVQAGLGSGNNVYEFTGATVADFNHDGIDDIAVAFLVSRGFSPPTNTEIAILNGSSSGTFTMSQHWMLGDDSTASIGDITAADFNGDGYPDLATLSYNPSNGYTTLYEYLNTPGNNRSSCALPVKAGTSVICQPATSSTVSAPVVVTAASNEPGFTLNRLYLDGVALYQNPAQSVSTQINASAGSHTLVLVSYNKSGQAVTSSTSFDVRTGGGGACLPSGPSAKICEPASGANVNSPVTVTAGAIAQHGNITAIRVYLDYNSIGTINNPSASSSFSINQSFVIGAGIHTLAIVAYQSTGGSLTASESIQVTGDANGGGCLPSTQGVLICAPTSGAKLNSPVTITAGAMSPNGITGIRAYIDNVAVLFSKPQASSKSYHASQQVNVGPGSHHLVVVGYEKTGTALTRSVDFSVDGPHCVPSVPGILLCSPEPNATVTSPLQISAAAMAQSGYITSIRAYMDNVAQFTTYNPGNTTMFSINQAISVSPGQHNLVIVAYQSGGGAATVMTAFAAQ